MIVLPPQSWFRRGDINGITRPVHDLKGAIFLISKKGGSVDGVIVRPECIHKPLRLVHSNSYGNLSGRGEVCAMITT
jgi:hypothetical protein